MSLLLLRKEKKLLNSFWEHCVKCQKCHFQHKNGRQTGKNDSIKNPKKTPGGISPYYHFPKLKENSSKGFWDNCVHGQRRRRQTTDAKWRHKVSGLSAGNLKTKPTQSRTMPKNRWASRIPDAMRCMHVHRNMGIEFRSQGTDDISHQYSFNVQHDHIY